jgi:hypothetical protein
MLLFYTSKDEEGGQGYEFLHKSFGEYLTACGMFGAFQRWGDQVAATTLDFDSIEFLRRWLTLCGPAPITKEILSFLRNEIKLRALEGLPNQPWKSAREWVEIAASLIDAVIKIGIPAHEGAKSWRSAEVYERNAEISLMAILDACAKAAYPIGLLGAPPSEGGWEAGPIHIPAFEEDTVAFAMFVARLTVSDSNGYVSTAGYPMVGPTGILLDMLSRLSLRASNHTCRTLMSANLEACNFQGAQLIGSIFNLSNLTACDFRRANLDYAVIETAQIAGCDFRGASLNRSFFSKRDMKSAKTDKPFRPEPPLRSHPSPDRAKRARTAAKPK